MCKSFEEPVPLERSQGCKQSFCDHMLNFIGSLSASMPNYCWLPFLFFSPLFPVNSHDQPLEGCTEDLWNETQCCHQVVAYYYYTNIYLTLCISFNWSQWTESLMCCLLEPRCVCRRVNLKPRLLLWSCVLLRDALIIRTAACLHLISFWRSFSCLK